MRDSFKSMLTSKKRHPLDCTRRFASKMVVVPRPHLITLDKTWTRTTQRFARRTNSACHPFPVAVGGSRHLLLHSLYGGLGGSKQYVDIPGEKAAVRLRASDLQAFVFGAQGAIARSVATRNVCVSPQTRCG